MIARNLAWRVRTLMPETAKQYYKRLNSSTVSSFATLQLRPLTWRACSLRTQKWGIGGSTVVALTQQHSTWAGGVIGGRPTRNRPKGRNSKGPEATWANLIELIFRTPVPEFIQQIDDFKLPECQPCTSAKSKGAQLFLFGSKKS